MRSLLLNIVLAFAWVALTGHFVLLNFAGGFLLGYAILYLIRPPGRPAGYFLKVQQVLRLAAFFVWELIKANLRVAFDVLSPRYSIRPGVVAIPLDIRTPAQITLLANLITLTPGTLSLDVSTDRKVLYVHSMYIKDVETFRKEIKEGFEKRVQEVFE